MKTITAADVVLSPFLRQKHLHKNTQETVTKIKRLAFIVFTDLLKYVKQIQYSYNYI